MTTPRTAPPPPAGLGKAGTDLWTSIAEQVTDDGFELDAREHRILSDAARTADDLARLEAELVDAPVMVVGSTGQPVPNRLFDEARKARQLIATLLRQVELTAAAQSTGRGLAATSQTARAAAAIRWGKNPTGAGGA